MLHNFFLMIKRDLKKSFRNLFILSFLLNGCGNSGSSNEIATPNSKEIALFSWSFSSPQEEGMDSDKLKKALEYAFDDDFSTQGLIVVRNGKVVIEQYQDISDSTISGLLSVFSDKEILSWGTGLTQDDLKDIFGNKDKDSLATSWSSAKSITSTLIGIAIEEGFIDSVDEYASRYLPDWIGTDKENSVTIKNLLEMRSLLKCPQGGNGGSSIYYQEDQLAPSKERNFDQDISEANPPYFNNWVYCNADTMLLGEILLNATGKSVQEFGDYYLFSKVGMTVDWWKDGKGNYLAYCCVDMTTRDFAKFGLLWSNAGFWGGEQIIPPGWIAESLSSKINIDWSETTFYNYQWYTHNKFTDTDDSIEVHGFGTKGYNTNNIWIIPSYNLIIVRNSLYHRHIPVGTEAIRTGDISDWVDESYRDQANYHLTLYPGNLALVGGQPYLFDFSNVHLFNSEKMVKDIIESINN
jgi:CubicO group peptidase (beta-lactamase class C family)